MSFKQENLPKSLDIFTELAKLGIKLRIKGDNLEILDDNSNLTPELLNYLKKHKENIISQLSIAGSVQRTKFIRKTEEKEYYELSSAQKRLFLLYRFDTTSLAYNMPAIYRTKHQLDIKKLTIAANALLAKHELLRTNFRLLNGEPVQQVNEHQNFAIEEYDYKNKVDEIVSKFIRPFYLEESLLLRIGLAHGPEKFLMVDMHHIVSDGISHEILVRDFIKFYTDADQMVVPKLAYKDFAHWNNKQLKKVSYIKQEAYWKEEFIGEIPVLDLPVDFSRPEVKSYRGGKVEDVIEGNLADELIDLQKENQVTSFMLFLTAYGILLSKLSCQDQLIIGTPSYGRNSAQVHDMVGVFINTLLIKLQTSHELTFIEFLKQVKAKVLTALDNRDYPYQELVNKVKPVRDISRNPLFDTLFSLDVVKGKSSDSNVLGLEPYNHGILTSKFDLSLFVEETDGVFSLTFEYCVDLFKEEKIQKYARYFRKILSAVAHSSSIKIGEIDIILKEEKNLLASYNNTDFEFDRSRTVLDLFLSNAAINPNSLAIKDGDNQITYGEFNNKTNILAQELIRRNVQKNEIIAVCMDRSLDFLLSIFSVMKAGAAYLPILPTLPLKRINYMLEDSDAVMVLTNTPMGMYTIQTLNINEIDLTIQNTVIIPAIPTPDSYAYTIYTSGSTGMPKGVLVSHKALMNRLNWMQYKFPIKEKDLILQKTPIIFDVSVWELFWWSTTGASLTILSPGEEKDPIQIIEKIQRDKVTTLHFVPSMLRSFLDQINQSNITALQSIKQIFSSGEALFARDVNKFNKLLLKNNNTRLINLYGPTEATIDVTYFECYHKETYQKIPIGRPIHNTQVFVLNKSGLLQPVDVWGELNIAGENLAVGYVNKKELTESKFYYHKNLDKRLYKTGDIVKWNNEGEIEFLGRSDFQIKIRGNRIELGEIENCLGQFDQIKDVVVDVKDFKGSVVLCAYYISDLKIETKDLKRFASQSLPEHMLPTFYMHLDELPITETGKINRKKLPTPTLETKTDVNYPQTETQLELQTIWSETLGVEKKHIHQDVTFFELGGHSLNATGILVKIEEVYKSNISLLEFFMKPTIGQLAELVDKRKGLSRFSSIQVAEKKEYYPLSSPQRRIFALHSVNPDSVAYNIPFLLKINNPQEIEKLENSFRTLIKRHDSLRTIFELHDSQPVQKITKETTFEMEVLFDESLSPVEFANSMIVPFELSKAPLFRAKLLKQGENSYYLLVDMHHIISDGISIQNLIGEVNDLLQEKPLNPMRLQYKDYVVWVDQSSQKKLINDQENFWLNQFAERIPVIDLPYDFERVESSNFSGNSVDFELDNVLCDKLVKLARDQGTTSFTFIFSIFSLFLSKITNQSEIVIGTVSSGRNHVDKEDMIGLFVNTLPIKTTIDQSKAFHDLWLDVHHNLTKATVNQDYQYESLVEKLKINRTNGRNPLFDVICVYQKEDFDNGTSESSIWENVNLDTNIAKFDLGLYVEEINGLFKFNFEYRDKLFKKSTILRLKKGFLRLLSSVVSKPEAIINEFNILDRTEEKKIEVALTGRQVILPNKTIMELFDQQVHDKLENIAIDFEHKSITYKELNKSIDAIASLLLGKYGLKGQERIAILMNRSDLMISSLLAVLKTNMIFVPIDVETPNNTIEYILKDADVSLLITNKDLKAKYKFIDTKTLVIDEVPNVKLHEKIKLPSSRDTDLAYIIYTSGSTGKPKGVKIRHISLLNYVLWANEYYFNNCQGSSMALFSPISFDFTLTSIFTTLIRFDSLHIFQQRLEINQVLTQIFSSNSSVNFVKLTPSHVSILKHLNVDGNNIKGVILGGERVKKEHIRTLKGLNEKIRIYNEYGPTEATVGCMVKELHNEDLKITIGHPINNTSVLVLNENNQIQPLGIAGELYISGVQLAQGYTNTLFSSERFQYFPSLGNKLFYKTGDMARYLDSGEVEYLGRNDDQVKIRGNRVELKHVENYINKIEFVEEAVAVARENENGEIYIAAYYTASKLLDTKYFNDVLKIDLPSYMIPSYFVRIENIPLTTNGKIDKHLLPNPKQLSQSKSDQKKEESDEVAFTLRKIWSEILTIEVEKIGWDDSFYELGGHSISTIMLASKIHKNLNVTFKIKEIADNPTLREQSILVRENKKEVFKSITKVEKREYYHISRAQKRMFLLHRMIKDNVTYNIPGAMIIEGELDIDKLENTCNEMMTRHEVLKTSFHFLRNEPYQKVWKNLKFKIEYVENNDITSTEKELIETFIKPFDLEQAPLFRVKVVKQKKNKYILLYDMHHIISDGTSSTIFIKDLIAIYNGTQINPLKIQYKEFANWQHFTMDRSKIEKQKKYWLKTFDKFPPLLNLPIDFPRKGFAQIEGEEAGITIRKEITSRLNEVSREENVTLFNVLFSAFNVLIAKFCNQDDIVVGIPSEKRNHADLEKQMGLYLNLLALRSFPKSEKSFLTFLKEVQQTALGAFDNTDFQFEQLVNDLNVQRIEGRSPLFDVYFNFLNFDLTVNNTIEGLKISPLDVETKYSKYDIGFYMVEQGNQLEVSCVYKKDLFRKGTINYLLKAFQTLLNKISENKSLNIGDYDIFEIQTNEEQKFELGTQKGYEVFTSNDIHQSIGERFELQVAKYGDRIAIEYEDESISYNNLNKKINTIANHLLDIAIKQKDVYAAILLDDRTNMVLSSMAILKSGYISIPLDVKYPKERLKFIIENSGAAFLLTDSQNIDICQELIKNIAHSVVLVNIESIEEEKIKNPNVKISCDNLAYVLYTSGSTGNPKGVMQSHKNTLHFCRVYTNALKLNKNDKLSFLSTYSFDAGIMDIFGALLNGGTLCPFDMRSKGSIKALKDWLISSKITIYHSIPSLFRSIYETFDKNEQNILPHIRFIVMGGEETIMADVLAYKKYFSDTCFFVNGLGPTESTVTLQKFIDKKTTLSSSKVSVGHSVHETEVLLLNELEKEVAVYEVGEIVYKSSYLSLGYLNDLNRTNKSFMKLKSDEGRVYKSGDLGRRLPNNEIEYVGRKDFQVKIRGFRIEVGEIENHLMSHNLIEKCVVILKEEKNDKYLAAFYTSKIKIEPSEIKSFLLTKLPDYMCPGKFVPLDEIPYNHNGKIDRPTIQKIRIKEDDVSKKIQIPTTETEIKMAVLWKKALNLKEVGNCLNFFELGGHSLKAVQLLNEIHKVFAVDITLQDFFSRPTIKSLSAYVETCQWVKKSDNSSKTFKKEIIIT
ncbi:amino acid adenylation domain-containing protein [Dokdonia sp.]|uniref:amino acid adenylation domain-containing protein n=1 Tax=Dokdonia sp. TaxID=2024995 RepID=UPI00326488FF